MTDSELTIKSLIGILTRRWRPVIGFSIVVLIVVYLASVILLENTYTASVKLLVSKSKTSEKVAQVDNTMLSTDTYIHFITSRDSLQEAMTELALNKPPYEYSLSNLEEHVSVRQIRNTELLSLEVTMPDGKKAKETANFLADRSIKKNFDELVRESEQSRTMFKQGMKEAHETLKETTKNLVRFMEESQAAPSEEYFKSAQEALWKLKEDRAFNVSLRDECEARIEAMRAVLDIEPQTRVLKRTISEDPELLALVMDKAGDVGEILGLKLESENVNFAFDKAKAELISASKDMAGAVRHVVAMDEEISLIEKEIRIAEKEMAEKFRLKEEQKISSFAYETAAKNHAEVGNTIARERQDLTIIEHAVEPEKPSGPKRMLTALSAAVAAFLLALFLSMGIDLYSAMD